MKGFWTCWTLARTMKTAYPNGYRICAHDRLLTSAIAGSRLALKNSARYRMRLSAVGAIATMLIVVGVSPSQSTQTGSLSTPEVGAKPLLLEKNEGEQRTWRPELNETDDGRFILKVTPRNSGSQHFVLLTDDTPPGAAIPRHKHLGQDEIVFIESGTVHAHVGDQERDLHAGGLAFIPAHTWVNLKNVGSEPVSAVAVFSAPGFEDHLRCESVPANEKATTISRAEENECDRLGHVVYKDRGEEDSPIKPDPAVKILLLEKNEGELRIWRQFAPETFMLKVSPKNNGSEHLVLLTEDLGQGDFIPTHKHLGQDEIVLIRTGTVHVRLGDQERDLHAGGMVFIPAYTWVAMKIIGSERVSLVGLFSAPGFENHLRCASVPDNEKPTPMTLADWKQCDQEGHVVYKDREETPKK
jgi:quercetin dioxygenase-like cupin family protein